MVLPTVEWALPYHLSEPLLTDMATGQSNGDNSSVEVPRCVKLTIGANFDRALDLCPTHASPSVHPPVEL